MKINPNNAKYYAFESITSTNDFAKELLLNQDLVVVSALHQTKGRGRNVNQWYGSYGNNLYLSVGIKHSSNVDSLTLAVMQAVGSLAVRNSLQELTNKNIYKIKYPNDIYAYDGVKYKKISGILVEHSFAGSECISSIIGIGVNVHEKSFPEDLHDFAISLFQLGFDIEIKSLQENIVNNIFLLLTKYSNIEIFELWKKDLNLHNKNLKVLGKESNYKLSRFFVDGRLELVDENNNKITIDNGDSIRYNLD